MLDNTPGKSLACEGSVDNLIAMRLPAPIIKWAEFAKVAVHLLYVSHWAFLGEGLLYGEG